MIDLTFPAILYGHFVDVVWLFLFVNVYWWSSFSINQIIVEFLYF